MRERPIIFNSEMVRAIIKGRKTQTRRPIHHDIASVIGNNNPDYYIYRCPYGQAGDRLWVRETFECDDIALREKDSSQLEYRATSFVNPVDGWIPSIHMPRWASRMLLEITDIRVERVQDITDRDIEAEGASDKSCVTHRLNFQVLWDQCYSGRGLGWYSNPWVWVVVFKRIEPMGKTEVAQ